MSELDVAVIGMAGRFPGAANVAEYWRNLAAGVESILPVSDEALEAAGVERALIEDPRYVKAAAVLDGADLFDAELFGFSPREAALMDPQERVFLEVAWEALEDAGYGAGHPGAVGVWASKSAPTYLIHNLQGGLDFRDFVLGQRNIQAFLGNGDDFIATRVSYRLNLTGPSMRVQTACSSALVGMHLARQSLLSGECDMALAGGVSIYQPQGVGYLYEDGLILSPDGHCRPFDVDAAGTVFGRGAGAVVLRRLEDALEDGDPVRAVLRGSAINNDGSSKVGYAAPSVRGQARVIAEALADADLVADDIGYVETHGTGTPQGDPVEMTALTQAFRRTSTRSGFCRIGSVKSNIGHVDVAAGAASVIKVVSMLEHRQMAPTLHFRRPNPEIDLESSPFRVVSELGDWRSDDGGPLRAGVSGFGIGGTNAHLVFEEAPRREPRRNGPERGTHLLTLSARTRPALAELAGRYADAFTQRDDLDAADACFTANVGRARHAHRLVVAGGSREELARGLRALNDEEAIGVWQGEVARNAPAPRIAFLFTGQGAQYVGMARELYETEPAFRRSMDACNEALAPLLERPLLDVLYGSSAQSALDETEYTQPALFSVEYSLAELWRSWGIEPDVVMGHSLGEYAAACLAGVFSLEDGLKLVRERGRWMAAVPAGGMMAAVFAGRDAVEAMLTSFPPVTVAAVNGPSNVVVSGPRAAVEGALAVLLERGVESRTLAISNGFHSPQVEPVLDSFEEAVRQVQLHEPTLPVVSTLTGQRVRPGEVSRSRYWRDHLRHAVQFRQAIETLVSEGVTDFVEIGPHSTLLGMARECVAPGFGHWHPSLRRDRGNWDQIGESLAGLWLRDAPVDWAGFDRGRGRRRVPLPTYPFEKVRHWISPDAASPVRGARAARTHAFLRGPVRSPLIIDDEVYGGSVGGAVSPSLDDHRVLGDPVFPLVGYMDAALAAARAAFGRGYDRVTDLVVRTPLSYPPGSEREIQIVLRPGPSGTVRWRLFSTEGDERSDGWTLHAEGAASAGDPFDPDSAAERSAPDAVDGAAPVPADVARATERCTEVGAGEYYERLAEAGLTYGPAYRGIARVWVGEDEAVARVEPPAGIRDEVAAGHVAHPALLDACLQVSMAPFTDMEPGAAPSPCLPIGVAECTVRDLPFGPLWSHCRVVGGDGDSTHECEVVVRDAQGRTLAVVRGLVLRKVDPARWIRPTTASVADWFYRVAWRAAPPSERAPEGITGAAVAEPSSWAPALRDRVASIGDAHGLSVYTGLGAQIDALAGDYAAAALVSLGRKRLGEPIARAALAHELGVLPEQERFLHRLVEMCEEDGAVQTRDGSLVLPAGLSRDPAERLRELRERTPVDLEPMWRMVERCGRGLAAAMAGDQNVLELLFPGGSLADLEALYSDSPFAHVYNAVLQEAVGEMLAGLPPGRRIRILEVGAGTGGSTAGLLPMLRDRCSEYVYTDASRLFLARAAERFRAHPFVRYALFDIEQGPQEQGIEVGGFDLVIASNVLHATRDLERTLANVRAALAPGGALAMVEGVVRQRWVDIVFGLTDGWWRFEDIELRRGYPLVPRETWDGVLERAGFYDVEWFPEAARARSGGPAGASGTLFGQAVAVARAGAGAVAPSGAGEDAPSGSAAESSAARRWLVFHTPEEPVGEGIVEGLRSKGDVCDVVAPASPSRANGAAARDGAPRTPAELRTLLDAAGARGFSAYDGILYLWGLEPPPDHELSADRLDTIVSTDVHGLLHVLRDALEGEAPARPMWVVTRGARPVTPLEEVPGLAHAPLWGLGQVAALEHPEQRCVRVDLDPEGAEHDPRLLLDELDRGGEEDQVAFRGGERWLPRLERVRLPGAGRRGGTDEGRTGREGGAGAYPYRIESASPGSLGDLRRVAATRRAPGAGEVEIAVASTGLNFKDVLAALGMYPGDPGPLGGECAGVVERVGEGVETLRPGDRVLAFAAGSLASFVTVPADLAAAIPDGWSFDRAASMLAAFLTADTALTELAGVGAGDTVLVHSGAGGVGMAAIQIARAAGATVLATAGSEAKRAFLRDFGVKHVMDSRSVSFGEEVLASTGGRGADVVVNSLAGPLLEESFRVTARGGRFVELGKNGVLTPPEVEALGKEIDYHLIDVAERARTDPASMRDRIRSLVERHRRGELEPLPRRAFGIEACESAFRVMAKGEHVGKLVLRHDRSGRPMDSGRPGFDATRGAWLIVGGLGGLGLLLARWLVDRGAPHVVLMGRSAPTADASEAVAALTAAGASVRVERGNVTREEDVRAALAGIRASGHRLSGVIQSAGVLDDGVLLQQTPEKFGRVLDPKVRGSWHLHRLTGDVDHFVLFSSIASVLGSPGQANHAAANAFLDSLAAYRRARGLAAQTIAWGAWSELGAAADRDLLARLSARGLGAISPAKGLVALEQALELDEPHVTVVPADWARYPRQPLLNDLAASARPSEEERPATEGSWVERIAAAAPSQKMDTLRDFIRRQVGRGLGMDASQPIDPERPLSEMGLDSLLAVELRNRLAAGLAMTRTLPATLLFDHPSIERLTRYLAREALGLSAADATAEPGGQADEELARIAALSDDEAAALLLSELSDPATQD